MIKELIIRDFFSFRGEHKIELNSGVNILVGINGSGKTSFLNAIALLYEGVAGSGLSTLFRQWGTYNAIINACGEQKPDCFSVTYVFDADVLKKIVPVSLFKKDVYYKITVFPIGDGISYSLCETLYSEDSRGQKKTFSYLEFRNGIGQISVRTKNGIKVEKYESGMLSAQELVLRQITDPQRYLPSFVVREAINAIAGYSKFDFDRVRLPAEANDLKRLISTGENLSQLLSYLNNNYTFQYEKIRECLIDINQNFKGIGYNVFGSRLYLSLRERNLSHAIDALHMSDGTLKYMLLLSIFYNPDRGALIDIDEPESCLHPDMIRSLAKMMKSASKTSQIIVATHSALLLNAFELDDILVFEKGDTNETQIMRYNEDDFESREGELLPGQLWLNGEIGGKRW
uniref:AAA family ATPase n=1 Tax=Candidatus Cryptobacteroides bacterium TaxID=3085639 RepID=UPI00402571D5